MNWSAHAKTSYSVYISTAVVMQSKFSAGEGVKKQKSEWDPRTLASGRF